MEYITLILLIVFGAIIYFGFKFVNFKSRLMNELGKRGLDYEAADTLYSIMADQINKMHHDGVSASSIADLLCSNIEQVDNSEINNNHFASFESWFEIFKAECDKTKAGVTPFLEFMDISPLKKAYEAGEDPKTLASAFAEDFDPLKIQ